MSVRIIGVRDMKIDRMVLSGDFRKRLSAQRVKQRARSITEVGLLDEPIVRQATRQVLAGEDRVAAHMILEKDVIRVKLVECSDEEAEQIHRDSNAQRRNNAAEPVSTLETVSKRAEQIAESKPDIPLEGAGRRKTAKGLAVDEVAKREGIKPASVRTRNWREQKKARMAEVKAEKREEIISCFGLDVDPAYLEKIEQIQKLAGDADQNLIRAQSLLSQMSKLPVPGKVSRVRDQLGEVAAAVRTLVPKSLCPYCKGLEQVMPSCAACDATGYVGTLRDVPRDLMGELDPMVLFQGKKVPVSSFAPEEEDLDLP